MGFGETLLLAVSLGLDTFAAALSLGIAARADKWRVALRLAGLLAVLHVLAPLVGWLAAAPLRVFISRWAPWLALALLAYAGARMIREGLAGEEDEHGPSILDDWRSLALLCAALSMDVIAVGVGLGLAGSPSGCWPVSRWSRPLPSRWPARCWAASPVARSVGERQLPGG